jgi:hypothetical protein
MCRLRIISFSRDFGLLGLIWQVDAGARSKKNASMLMDIWPPLLGGSGKCGGYGCSSKL